MPELPDLEVYLAALDERITGRRIAGLRLLSPFFLRTVDPPAVAGRTVRGLERLGKRIVIELDGALFLIVHLMIAGRLRWLAPGKKPPGRITLALLELEGGALAITEAGSKRRAWLRVVEGREALAALDPGGVEPLAADDAALRRSLAAENRTLKRALTDPRRVAGIGNSYSDEILWEARLSPFARIGQLDETEWARLLAAIRATLAGWRDRLEAERGDGFPAKVTAFREGMAVHGRYGAPCPRCGKPVQRIVYAENEANYCAGCQTGGRLLADRALSRLLHHDWPRTLEELEERAARSAPGGGGESE